MKFVDKFVHTTSGDAVVEGSNVNSKTKFNNKFVLNIDGIENM